MKIKLGKLFNSIKNNRCCPTFHFVSYSKLFKSNISYNKLNSNQLQTSSKNFSLKQNLMLFYYTFIYNESSDMLSIIEAILHPFVDCFGRLLRVVGWVKIMLFLFIIFLLIKKRFSC